MSFPRSPTIEPWLHIASEEATLLTRRFADVYERGDLKAVGALALFEAVANHDARHHDAFPHYARCFVRGRMLRAIVRELRYGQLKARLWGEAAAAFAMGELVLDVDIMTAEPQELVEAGRVGCDELLLAALIAGVSVGTGFASQEDLQEAEEYARAIELVGRLLRGLPEEMRTPIELVYAQGLTHGEAAKQLGVHRKTIGYRIGRALRSMRDTLIAEGIFSKPNPPRQLAREKSVWPSGGDVFARGPPDSSRGPDDSE